MMQTLNFKASNAVAKNNNLWTAEARDDMFQRREKGETWETICKDYPKRSRHAMQQQYSMMKKQKAIADGTWTTNKRGRKRRIADTESWPSRGKGQERWDAPDQEDEMTDDDEDSDLGDMEDTEGSERRLSNRGESEVNGRPAALMRSATDPSKPAKPTRNGSFPPQVRTSSQTNLVGSNGHPVISEYNGSGPGRKRQKFFLEPSGSGDHSFETGPMSSYASDNVILDRTEVMRLLEMGMDRARQANKAMEEWKATQKQVIDRAINRANVRTTEANDALSGSHFNHGDEMKAARLDFSETLKAKSREHAEEIKKLKKKMAAYTDPASQNIMALEQEIEELRKSNEALKAARPNRESELERENQELKAKLKQKEDVPQAEHVESVPLAATAVVDQVTNEVPMSNGDPTSLDLNSKLDEYPPLAKPVDEAFRSTASQYESLATMITNLEKNLPDMTQRRIVGTLKEISSQNATVSDKFRDLKPLFENVLASFLSHQAQFSEDVEMKDVGVTATKQEAPRTPPEEHHDEPVKAKVEATMETKVEANGTSDGTIILPDKPHPEAEEYS